MNSFGRKLARDVEASRATLILAVVSTILTWMPNALLVLPLDRSLPVIGESWRLITAHLVHSDLEHLGWNILGLLILGAAFEPLLKCRFSGVLLVSALIINAWFYWLSDTTLRYCGLSGCLNAVLILGLLEWHRRSGEILPLLILAGAVGKTAFEMLSGVNVFSEPAWRSVPEVHLVGMWVGFISYASHRLIKKPMQQSFIIR